MLGTGTDRLSVLGTARRTRVVSSLPRTVPAPATRRRPCLGLRKLLAGPSPPSDSSLGPSLAVCSEPGARSTPLALWPFEGLHGRASRCWAAPERKGQAEGPVWLPGRLGPGPRWTFRGPQTSEPTGQSSLLYRQTQESGIKESVSWGTQRTQEVPSEARTPLERGHSTEIPVAQPGKPVRVPGAGESGWGWRTTEGWG